MPRNSSRTPLPNHDLVEEVEILGSPGGDALRLRFHGPFEGKDVCWNATFFTQDAWANAYNEPTPRHNIIDIRESDEDGFTLALCLKVKCIDRPTVRKAVMMVRQYKRLGRGRHVYG